MPSVLTSVQKCLTCHRWEGERFPVADGHGVECADEKEGVCRGGPWDGVHRSPLTRCGRWVAWLPAGLSAEE